MAKAESDPSRPNTSLIVPSPNIPDSEVISGFLRELRKLGSQESLDSPEWFKPHPLTLIKDINDPFNAVDQEMGEPLVTKTQEIYNDLQKEYTKAGCSIVTWSNSEGLKFQSNPQDLQSIGEVKSNAVTINPVVIGSLSDSARRVLEDEKSSLKEYVDVLRDELPESKDIYAATIGKKLGLKPRPHPHFANLIYIEDQNDAISKLSHEKMLVLNRMLLVKLGAFKNIFVTYKKVGEKVEFNNPILGTLEGGHPTASSNTDLAWRLMAFGSSRPVEGYNILEDIKIKEDEWWKNIAVSGMINFGKFMGKHNLLSPPVAIRELTKNAARAEEIETMLEWTRQAEGAFCAGYWINVKEYDKDKKKWVRKKRYVHIVSNSGTSGAVKDQLNPEEISAVYSVTDGKADVIQVEGIKNKKPSVEAEEFVGPLSRLKTIKIKEIKQNVIQKLKGIKQGFTYANNSEEGTEVPPVRAVFHLHRGLDRSKPLSNKVAYLELDPKEFPHVGCGVDTMQRMSEEAMKRAVKIWEESERKTELVLVYVPNHGINGFAFYTPDKNGIIPKDPYEQTTRLIENGGVVLTSEVPQV